MAKTATEIFTEADAARFGNDFYTAARLFDEVAKSDAAAGNGWLRAVAQQQARAAKAAALVSDALAEIAALIDSDNDDPTPETALAIRETARAALPAISGCELPYNRIEQLVRYSAGLDISAP